MKPNKKTLVIGGMVVTAGLILWLRHKKASENEPAPTGLEPAVVAPSTHYAFPVGEGGGGGSIGGTGGGAPSAPAPGVTTSPELEHNHVTNCGTGEHAVGVSAMKGEQGGIHCVKETRNGQKVPTTTGQNN